MFRGLINYENEDEDENWAPRRLPFGWFTFLIRKRKTASGWYYEKLYYLCGMEKKARNFREYPVWQEAVALSTKVYELTGDMPWFEKKGLCDQLQRAVVSIASNIAEGSARPSDVEFAHFLDIALGSSYEVETQLLISKNIGYISSEVYETLISLVLSIESQLSGLIRKVRQ